MVAMQHGCQCVLMLFGNQLATRRSAVSALAQEIATPGSPRAWSRYLGPLLAFAAAVAVGLVIALHGHDFVRPIERALHASWSLVALGAAFEAFSLLGYVALLHHVVARASTQLRLKDSVDMTLGGAAATRLLPTAGLGGAAVTVWALRARGVTAREVTERLLSFFLLLYGVYLAALFASGAAVASGLAPVSHGRVLGTVGMFVAVILAAGALSVVATPRLSRGLLHQLGSRSGRLGRFARGLETELPALSAALARAGRELRRPQPALIGALAWWAFDIGVLFVMLHAFGSSPSVPVIVLAYFLGTFCNLLPVPGSLSGGLVGTLIALGTPAGGALAAVLAYRAIAVWLPAVSGIPALSRLRISVASWRSDQRERRPEAPTVCTSCDYPVAA
jgi:uncharacterized membrane protein YbhN (UPF0104 family)